MLLRSWSEVAAVRTRDYLLCAVNHVMGIEIKLP